MGVFNVRRCKSEGFGEGRSPTATFRKGAKLPTCPPKGGLGA